jgi:hypothetical protein
MTGKILFMVTTPQMEVHTEPAPTEGSKGAVTVLLAPGDAGIGERRVHVLDRLTARLRAPQLDRDLSRGARPEATVALALRARALVGNAVREDVLRGLRRAIALDSRPARMPSAPICRQHVRAASQELQAVCDRLAAAGPVSAHGMAQLMTLLADGSGPLYRPKSPDVLGARLHEALVSLDRFTPDAGA